MKILITGGTGLIGVELIKHLAQHQFIVLTRNSEIAQQKLCHIPPNTLTYINKLNELSDLNSVDVVINLAGEPIADKRWTTVQKQRISDSRWTITEQIVELINNSANPPHTFISGSAVGYYTDQGKKSITEAMIVESNEFTHLVCQRWEELALKANSAKTRVCLLRTGVVLSPCGGALKKMFTPYKLGLGGSIGKGDQFMPWIHILDMIRAIVFLIETPTVSGPVNCSAPHPVTNRIFSQTLAKTLNRPHLFLIPSWLIGWLMGESSSLLLDSMRVKPGKLTHAGFEFQFSRLDQALKNLLEIRC